MNYIKAVLILIEIVSCLLLVVVILLQRSKSEGLGLAFGAQMGESLFGARASNVLVKATIWLGVIFLVNTTVLAKIYFKGPARSLISESSAPIPVERQSPAPASQPLTEPAQPIVPLATPATPLAPAPSVPLPAATE
ncbi:MAG: preprotein translocase subunit SecG [Lentisphaerae bacterium]|nr:preprotein translocase subunit SecG [Lentisphaerota bacterium]